MKPIGIVVHHTVTDKNISPEDLRAIFKSRFGVDYIGYNYYIRGNGEVHSDIGPEGIGIHNNIGNLNNTNSVGISLAGNFEEEEPTNEQLNALSNLIKELQSKYNIPDSNIVGHRDMKSTACPGQNLYKYKPWKKEVDMSCKIDDQKALDMRRHLVYKTFNLILGRSGNPEEQTVADNASWIDRDSGDQFNYPGMANYVVNLYNSDEARASRQKPVTDAIAKTRKEDQEIMDEEKRKSDLLLQNLKVTYEENMEQSASLAKSQIESLQKKLDTCNKNGQDLSWREYLSLALKKLFNI